MIKLSHFSGGNSNAPLVLPPGMSIEQKTEFLSNLDPKHQSFISMPHTNAGGQNSAESKSD